MPLHSSCGSSCSAREQRPYGPSIGNGAGVGCSELQQACSCTKMQLQHKYDSRNATAQQQLLQL